MTNDGPFSNVKVIHVMPRRDKQIQGIATLDSELFLVREDCQQIEVYHTLDFTRTGHVTVSDMKHPLSLVACSHHNCLYIGDYWYNDDDSLRIHRVELSDRSVTKWSVNGWPEGLSITRTHNLLVTLNIANKIQEYTTYGELLREIILHDSIDKPRHSIELSTGQFVVCHEGESLHRVCIVDTHGHIVRSYGRTRGSADGQLDRPICLAVDTSDHVLVVDYNSNKVRLLSSSLDYLGDITLLGQRHMRPYQLYLDHSSCCLYISED